MDPINLFCIRFLLLINLSFGKHLIERVPVSPPALIPSSTTKQTSCETTTTTHPMTFSIGLRICCCSHPLAAGWHGGSVIHSAAKHTILFLSRPSRPPVVVRRLLCCLSPLSIDRIGRFLVVVGFFFFFFFGGTTAASPEKYNNMLSFANSHRPLQYLPFPSLFPSHPIPSTAYVWCCHSRRPFCLLSGYRLSQVVDNKTNPKLSQYVSK